MPVANSNPAVASAITAWFRASARDLPWRSTAGAPPGHRRDPYRTLVSEVMLQQTQVARVLERFDRFIEAFPTVADLARADEREVMGLWSGLGYYRRARLLHAAARCIAGEHGGSVPSEIAALRAIPGIGPYTAGAISSLAHGRPTPLVDGNVARVLFRIHGRDAVHADAADLRWAWGRAGELIAAAEHAGIFAPDVNEGLMELGATICTPSAPDCLSCPVRELCIARGAGRQNEIPRPKRAVVRCSLFCASILLADSKGRAGPDARSNRREGSIHASAARTMVRRGRAQTPGRVHAPDHAPSGAVCGLESKPGREIHSSSPRHERPSVGEPGADRGHGPLEPAAADPPGTLAMKRSATGRLRTTTPAQSKNSPRRATVDHGGRQE